MKKKNVIKLKSPGELQVLCMCICVCACACVRVSASVCACACVHLIPQLIIQQEVLDIARDLLEEIKTDPSTFGDSTELERKLKQTKAVLEMYV